MRKTKPIITSNVSNNKFCSEYKKYIKNDLSKFEEFIKKSFHDSSDLVFRKIKTNKGNICFVYIDGLVNTNLLDRDIIKPLNTITKKNNLEDIIEVSQLKTIDINENFTSEVLDGNVAILCENADNIYISDLKDWSKRAVEKPDSESVIRGPKESFTETIRVNTSLIRRKIKNPNLVFENMKLGKQTNTIISLCYIKGIVNEEVLKKLKEKLTSINTDAVLETGYIEQLMEKKSHKLLPTVGVTQKPDVAAARMLEGRIVILCDGTPHVITVPHLFIEHLQTSADYYNKPFLASFLRIIRMIGLLISIILPGAFVAITTYHHEMIPTTLLITISSTSVNVPFPKGAECLIVLLIFEIIKESGTRLPEPIGSAVSIVGATIIGEAAVQAGLVGPPMIIIMGLAGLSGFILPSLMGFMTLYRFVFVILGTAMGLLGMSAGIMIVLIQLFSMESFGLPYMSITNSNNKIRDFIIRYSPHLMKYRPNKMTKNKVRTIGDEL